MGNFFAYSWVILLITGLVLVGGKLSEDKSQFITKHVKLEMKGFYTIVTIMGLAIAIANFIALQFFGSWKMMIYVIVAVLAVGYIAMYFLKKNSSKK